MASLATTACTLPVDYGSTEQHATTDGGMPPESEDSEVVELGGESPTDADYDDDDMPWLTDELVSPSQTCSYVSANWSACADPDAAARVAELEQKLKEKRDLAAKKAKAAKDAVNEVLVAADVKIAIGGKFPAVATKGNKKRVYSAMPYEVREKLKAQFSAANAEQNDGWIYDENASNEKTGEQYMTQEELDRLVDATNKGAGGLVGMQARKLDDRTYAVIQGDRVVLFKLKESASNPYSYTANHGEFSSFHTEPDDDARFSRVSKWLMDHRWKAFAPTAQAIIGTDPARTRDQMIDAAIARAIQDAKDAQNPFTAENLYAVIQILPITGTIDAIQRGDCPDAIASALTDVATLVGFWPAKIFRLGKLRVPAVMVMLALDGGAAAIRIAYQKDGAWVEALITVAFQARALRQAIRPLLQAQRARALGVAALAALSTACDKAEKAVDEAVAAEDDLLKARDELDKARIELEKSLRIPCDFTSDPDDDVVIDTTGDSAVAAVCEDTFEGTLVEAIALHGVSRSIEPSTDADETAAIRELAVAQDSLASALATDGPISLALACASELVTTVEDAGDAVDELATEELEPVTTARIVAYQDTAQIQDGPPQTTPTQTTPTQTTPTQTTPTQTTPTQTTPTQPTPTTPAQPAPPVACPAPAADTPKAADLVKRFDAAQETVKKMQSFLAARRATAEDALITSLVMSVARMYGVGTDHVEKLLQEFVNTNMKQHADKKLAWNSDVERSVRLTFMTYLGSNASDGKPLEGGIPIKLAGQDKADELKRLEGYWDSYWKIRIAENDNNLWPIRKGAGRLATLMKQLPTLEEWAKNCTPITGKMLLEIGILPPGKLDEKVVIDAEKFAAFLKKIEQELATYEAAVAKAAGIVLKDVKK